MTNRYELREIPGYKGYYMTEEPRFLSTNGGLHLLKIWPPCGSQRYPTVRFNENKSIRVHKLVALTFPDKVGGTAGEGKEIDHINGNREDNRPENLRWVSHYENMNNPITKERMRKTRGKEVWQYTKSGVCIGKYYNAAAAERETGIAANTINMVANGTPGRHSAGGFVWRYF